MREDKGLGPTQVQVKAQGAPLRWQCQTLSVLTTEGDLKLLRNALQGQGPSLPGLSMVLGLETVTSQQDTLYFWQGGLVLEGQTLFFIIYVTSVHPLLPL